MKDTRTIMGMHITVDVRDQTVTKKDLDTVFAYFISIDNKFSTYKKNSEISQINKGLLKRNQYSRDMQLVLQLCEKTKKETHGYFDIAHNNQLDPSGLVKGWAIFNASAMLKKKGFKNYYVDAGGDIQTAGFASDKKPWSVGIRNPFNHDEIVKVVAAKDCGIATSGTAIRGEHIYNPLSSDKTISEIVSLSVIGQNVYDADRFATAAFAMGRQGIYFIESLPGFAGYMIDKQGIATQTTGFTKHILLNSSNISSIPV